MCAAGLVEILVALNVQIPVTNGYTIIASNWPIPLVSRLILLTGVSVLTFGFPGEIGVTGTSLAGRFAMLVFGASEFLRRIPTLFYRQDDHANIELLSYLGQSIEVAVIAATALAGLIIWRAQLVQGTSRWILMAVAAVDTVVGVVEQVPSPTIQLQSTIWHLDLLPTMMVTVLGLSYILQPYMSGLLRWFTLAARKR